MSNSSLKFIGIGAGIAVAAMVAIGYFLAGFNFPIAGISSIFSGASSESDSNTSPKIEENEQTSQEKILEEQASQSTTALDNSLFSQYLQEEFPEQQQQTQSQEQQQYYEKELRRQNYENIVQLSDTNPLVKGLISGQLNFYIQPVPSYAAEGVNEQVEKVADTLDGHTYLDIPFNRVYNEQDADLRVYWIKNIGSHLGAAIFKSYVQVGLGTDSCYREWQPFDAWTVTKILWHELGHSLGFKHSSNSNNIMYYQTDTKLAIDYDERLTLDEGHYYYIPFCNSGEYYYQMSGNDQSNGFEVYVITPETDPAGFIAGQSGKYYPDCSGEKSSPYVTFSGSCSIPLGSKLLIYNRDDVFQTSAISVDVKIIDMNEGMSPDMTWNMEDFEYDQAWLNKVQSLSAEFTSS